MTARLWLVLALAGAGLLLVLAGQPWVLATADDAVLGATQLTVGGAAAAPAAPAAALLAGAAVVAGLAGSRPVRLAAAGCLVLAGVVGMAAAVGVLRDPGAVAGAALAERTGVTGAGLGPLGTAEATAWCWAALLAAALVALGGAVRLVRPPDSGAPSGRRAHQAAPDDGPATVRGSDWERMSDGDDPTDDPPTRTPSGPSRPSA